MALIPAQFIRQHQFAVLSTQSLSHPGYPFGSVVPYLISSKGDIAIYISDLAEHTKNITANNKVSLTISDTSQANSPASVARITCLADAMLSQQQQAFKQLYRQQFSDAEIILPLAGFQFYELKLTAVRLIAGFGEIRWLSAAELDLK